jgi:ribosomal protein L11 methyltransferase
MPRTFVLLPILLPEEQYEIAYGILYQFDVIGIEEKFDSMVICFDKEQFSDSIHQSIQSEFANLIPEAKLEEIHEIVEQNWNADWEATVQPIVASKNIVIVPEWNTDKFDQPIKIIITPQMSFGTGYHCTTRMMCQLLEQYVKPNTFWIDAGTGTGVLAIAAQRLGASKLYACDNDEWSVLNTNENLERNDLTGRITVEQVDLLQQALPLNAHGIVANLYRNVILPCLPMFYASLSTHKGILLLSGILVYDAEEIITAATNTGFTHLQTIQEDEWVGIALTI